MLTILLKSLQPSATMMMLLLSGSATGPAVDSQPDPVQSQLNAEEQAAGFKLLFNGKDLTGWAHNGKPGSFTVKDGIIVGDRLERWDLAYWLSTEREYGDFELRLQYKIGEGGNSGIFIRAPHEGRASLMGMEVQIVDDHAGKDAPGVSNTGAIYRVVAPKALASKPAGQWNDLWILCDGDLVKVTLNRQVITDATMAAYKQLQSRPRKGYIGLSAHTKPTQFRNIRLREIVHQPTEQRGPTTNPASAPAARPLWGLHKGM